jgi:hypothetical protein
MLKTTGVLIILLSVINNTWALENTSAPVASLKIAQTKIGNIFIEGEPISFTIQASAQTANWSITDVWGRVILKGNFSIVNGTGNLVLPIKQRGYFQLKVNAGTAAAETSLGVLTPFDIKKVSDSPFGICTHFSQGFPPEAMTMVALAGIKNIRDELYWSNVEREKGKYDFSAYWYMDLARRTGLRPLIGLTYGNPLYDGGNAPCTPEGMQAYANYGRATATTFGDILEGLEVWNEYNCGFNTGKTGNSTDTYYQMLKATYETIKAARPETKVVGVGMSCLPWEWLERLFKLDSLKYMDVVSMHPYRWDRWDELPPESLNKDMAQLNGLIKKYNSSPKTIPAWSTEVSWSSVPKWQIDPKKQADYIVRTYVVLLGQGIEKNYWYQLCCDLDDGQESQFGIVRHWTDPRGKLTPKPAYAALAVMTRQLTGWTFVSRENIAPSVWSLRFKKGDDILRVVWSTTPSGVTINTDHPLTVTDMMGNDELLHPVQGETWLMLGESPVYLKGQIKGIQTGSKISVVTRRKVACGDPIELKVSAAPAISGILEIEGSEYPVEGKAGMKIIVFPGEKLPQTRTLLYRFKIEGKIVGQGGLAIEIMDPIVLKSAAVKKKDLLEFSFENHSAVREVKLSSIDWEIGGKKGNIQSNLTFKTASTQAVQLPVSELKPFAITPVKVQFYSKDGWFYNFARDISYSVCTRQPSLKEIKSRAIDLTKEGNNCIKNYQGAGDLSGLVWLGWDDTYFYLTARIEDNQFYQKYPQEENWRGDGIQFGVAMNADNRYEFSLVMTSQGPHAECSLTPIAVNSDTVLSQSKFIINREGNILIYRAAIPWSVLSPIKPVNGSFLFSFLANDNDGEGRKGWIEWASGIGTGKDVTGYQRCLFVEN